MRDNGTGSRNVMGRKEYVIGGADSGKEVRNRCAQVFHGGRGVSERVGTRCNWGKWLGLRC